MNSSSPNNEASINEEDTPNLNLNLPQHNARNIKSYLRCSGGAINESPIEFDLFQKYLNLGVTRSVSNLYNYLNVNIDASSSLGTVPSGPRISVQKLRKISQLNNWQERALDYDHDNYTLELLEAEKSKEIEHKAKLEAYRAKQEFLGQLASRNAAMLLKLISNKVENILLEGEDLTLEQLKPLGDLAAKLAETGKNISSESLGVNELLELLDDPDE